MRSKTIGAFFVAGVAVLLVGCGGGGKEVIPTYQVKGKVTYTDGSPVKGVYVIFQPVKAEKGTTSAQGKLNDDGTYALRTKIGGEPDGARAGSYKVIFSLIPIYFDTTEVVDPALEGLSPEELKAKSPVHVKYLDAATSPLTAEVKSGDSQSFDFQVDRGGG